MKGEGHHRAAKQLKTSPRRGSQHQRLPQQQAAQVQVDCDTKSREWLL
jgi:hypothetical protein